MAYGVADLGLRLPDLGYHFDCFLRFSDENTCEEHQCSAKTHLQSCGEHRSIHESMPDPGDDTEFDKDNGNCNPQGELKLPDKKREGVANASQRRHGAADDTAHPWVATAGKAPVIG